MAQGFNCKNLLFLSNYTIYIFLGTAKKGAVHIPYQKWPTKAQKRPISAFFPKSEIFKFNFLINFVLKNLIIISNMAMKYAIFLQIH